MDEYDTLAREFLGENYQKLTPKEQMAKLYENVPLDSEQQKAAFSVIDRMSDEDARAASLNLMKAMKTVPKVLKALEDALAEYEKRRGK